MVKSIGSAAQQAYGLNSSELTSLLISDRTRQYLMLQNTGIKAVYFNFGANATTGKGSIRLEPLSSITFEGQFIPSGALSVLCSDTGEVSIIECPGSVA